MEQENNITTYNNSSEISAVADNIPEFHNSTIDPIWNDDATFFGQRMSREEYEKQDVIVRATSVILSSTIENFIGADRWKNTSNAASKVGESWDNGDVLGVITNVLSTGAGVLSDVSSNLYASIRGTIGDIGESLKQLSSTLEGGGYLGEIAGNLTSVVGYAASAYSTVTQSYNDGVTETEFGSYEYESWAKFIDYTRSSNSNYKIKILKSTPLDPGSSNQDLYGNMILGAPFLMTDRTDPHNRTMVETFVKDSRFLSLTPGMPKYNGSRYNLTNTSSFDKTQRNTKAQDMFDYLIQNGVNQNALDKDKRYYSFKPEYGKFYSYLETFLNMVWIRLGLGTEGDGTFNLYSFFSKDPGSEVPGLNHRDDAEPLNRYKKAIGIFVNPTGAVTENITNERTNFGGELASSVNSNSDAYQQINFLTGMGTGGSVNNTRAIVGKSAQLTMNIKNFLGDTFNHTISGWQSNKGLVRKVGGAALGAVQDALNQLTKTDPGVNIQAMVTTNGMRIRYPELWSDGSYSKSMNFQFNFTSPYGDPLSIFKYVYVPFGVLLSLTLQRQADDNGLVSPFFIRADLPGYFTCDLGFISNMSFTRGGPNGLFTKDGLPRSISGDFTIEDLYPYLAMSRRISFLSANPSYTSFVDSMIGLNAVNSEDNSLDTYWNNLLNRVNGQAPNGLWNKYNSEGRAINTQFGNRALNNGELQTSKFKSVNLKTTTWFRTI